MSDPLVAVRTFGRKFEAFRTAAELPPVRGDAKADDTRDRRIAQAVEWMAEGKPRNWKYM